MSGATTDFTKHDLPYILIVEDDPVESLMLSKFLEQEHYKVLTVPNGQEALLKCKKSLPDIILMDAIMPELDGFRCSEILHKKCGKHCPPILMITGLEDSYSVDHAFAMGAIDYVTKPIHWAVLRQRISRILKAHHDHQALQASLEKERSLHQELQASLDKERSLHQELQASLDKERSLLQELQIANQKLQSLATIDTVTQIANRRVFDERLQLEWQRLRREQSKLSMILVNIDYFQSYIDTYGHSMGDECLCKIAQIIKDAVRRPADLVARYGSTEFAMILPNTTSQGAVFLAERIRQQLQEKPHRHKASTVSAWVTLSIGVATTIPYDDDPHILVQKADEMLYLAKERGRDRVIADGDMIHAFPFKSPFAQTER